MKRGTETGLAGAERGTETGLAGAERGTETGLAGAERVRNGGQRPVWQGPDARNGGQRPVRARSGPIRASERLRGPGGAINMLS